VNWIFHRKGFSSLNFSMQKVILILFLLISLLSYGQNRPLLYNVDDLPQSLIQNPGARIDFTRHIGVPFFSQIHLFAGSTGVTAHDVFSDENQNVNDRVRGIMNRITAGDFFVLHFFKTIGDNMQFIITLQILENFYTPFK